MNDEIFLTQCMKGFAPVGGGIYEKDFLTFTNSGKNATLEGIKGLLPAINTFLNLTNTSLCPIKVYNETNKTDTSEQLKDIFTRCGSDKAGPNHRYDLVYGEIFEKFNKNSSLNILEVGLGSQNSETLSRMGGHFTVGGSHRAYREYFPNAQIYGADIDTVALFEEERIKTTYVDQLKPDTFEEMHKAFGCPAYDLIIEDGLHSFTASLNTLNFALKYIKKEGVIVLEDLGNHGNLWNMVFSLLITKGYKAKLINSKGLMLIIFL